ncbi:unnamed protein product, partial [Cyprideis torosa]
MRSSQRTCRNKSPRKSRSWSKISRNSGRRLSPGHPLSSWLLLFQEGSRPS